MRNDEGDDGSRDRSDDRRRRRKRKRRAGKDQPKVSFGGGGGLGIKREDDYPSFSTAIRATKNIKKIHTVAVDGHQMMKRHTTTNQKTVSVMGGGIMTNWDRGGTYRGDDFPSFGAANNATKN